MLLYKIICSECKQTFEIPVDEIPKQPGFVIVGMAHNQIDDETRCDGIIVKNSSESEDQFFDPISLSLLAIGATVTVGLAAAGATVLAGWWGRNRNRRN
jgi:hypothetical protein